MSEGKGQRLRGANLLLLAGMAVFALSLLLREDQQPTQEPPIMPPVLMRPAMIVPPDNPQSAARVTLGRHLFYDRDLSFNGTVACASCHRQALAFTDGLARSPGATGELTRRNAMSLANVGYNAALTWADSGVTSLEQQALIPLTAEHPLEMGLAGHEAQVLARLAAKPPYPDLFASAFPGEDAPVTLANVTRGLAAFQRTLLSYDSAYDRFLAGDSRALGADALAGRALFFSERTGCARCHGGHNFRFTLGHRKDEDDRSVAFHNTGLYNIDGAGAYPASDRGLFEVTGAAADMGRFKTPTLRNVALTAPYMHDGSIKSLAEVLDHYARGGRLLENGPDAGDGSASPLKSELVSGFAMTEKEKGQLLAFLNSLTDEAFVTRADLADPWASRD